MIDDARSALPEAGWEIRSRGNASPQLERTINRFTQFLTLVGLAALLVGGVGVANAVKSHIDRRRDVIAIVQGARRHRPRRLHDLSDAGGRAGRDRLGDRARRRRRAAVRHRRRVRQAAAAADRSRPCTPDELALSFVYGLLTALAFGLWPLGRVHDVPVAALFREAVAREWHRPRWSYLALMAVVIALLVAVAIGLSYDKRVAAVFVVSSVAVFALLRGVAAGLMALARRLPRAASPCCGSRSPTSTGPAR